MGGFSSPSSLFHCPCYCVILVWPLWHTEQLTNTNFKDDWPFDEAGTVACILRLVIIAFESMIRVYIGTCNYIYHGTRLASQYRAFHLVILCMYTMEALIHYCISNVIIMVCYIICTFFAYKWLFHPMNIVWWLNSHLWYLPDSVHEHFTCV